MAIHRLNPLVANQIAAGEVVERPASVVKELVENSLDATATRIDIDIAMAGKAMIKITDNGKGIEKPELALALARHATSKLVSVEDFKSLQSYGFRGEALASIAAVSKLTLTSRTETADAAYAISVQGEAQTPHLYPASHPVGTTVEVRELFHNVPVRRQFLRHDRTEKQHIDAVIKKLALGAFDVAFHFQSDQVPQYAYPVANTPEAQEKRVEKICGYQFLAQSKKIDISASGMRLWGWITDSTHSRADASLQYFYINHRFVKDKLLNHAIRQAYQHLIPNGRHPGYVLYLELAPSEVDVNVHPTKHEVRFQQVRYVHDFLCRAINQALQTQTTPLPEVTVSHQAAAPVSAKHTAEAQASVAVASRTVHTKQPARSKTTYHEQLVRPVSSTLKRAQASLPREPFKPAAPEVTPTAACAITPSVASDTTVKAVATLYDQFILYQNDAGTCWFIDALDALATTHYVTLLSQYQARQVPQAPLLWITHQSISATQESALQENKSVWTQLGWDIDSLGPGQIAVRAVPAVFQKSDVSQTLSDLLEGLSAGCLNESQITALCQRTAKLAARAQIRTMSDQEKVSLYQDCCREATGNGQVRCREVTSDAVAKLYGSCR